MAAEIPKNIRATLYIDGKPAEGSLKNLEQATQRLNRELKGLEVGTEAWNKKMRDLKNHKKALSDINTEIKGVHSSFSHLKEMAGGMAMGMLMSMGFMAAIDQFRQMIVGNAELSDSFADVRKTTGISEEGIRRLNSELSKLDTRSTKSELLGLAEVAGKLGVNGERAVLGFVRAADKIGVALGKDLGGTEEAVNSLGKIAELFKVKDQYGLEDALIRTGSAINALGAAGTANEGYIVEFTKRMGPIAPAANISLEAILGLAATFDELGQPAEAATTAIGQFVIGMGADIPKYAKVAGMSTKAFSDLLKNDGNAALISVLKNLKSTGQGVEGLAKNMGMVGADGARAIAAIGALSNNLDLLKQRQQMANEEFAKGTSLQTEFNVKNENFAAVLAKVGKAFKSFTANTILIDFLKNLVFGFSQLVEWGSKNMVMIVTLTKLVLIGVTAWASYKIAVLLSASAMEAYAARTTLARTATLAFAGIQALLTGNLGRAQAAMRALNITMSANPVGAVVAVVITLIAAFALLSKTTSEAEKLQKSFNELEADAAKNRNSEIQKIKELKSVIDSETTSREQKLKAVAALRLVMPEALQHLTDEEALTNKGTIAINKYVKALEDKTLAEAAQSSIRKLQERNIDLNNSANDKTSTIDDALAFAKAGGNLEGFKANRALTGRVNSQKEINSNNDQIKAIQEKYGKGMIDNLLVDPDAGGTSTYVAPASKKKSAAEIAKEKELEAIKKLLAEINAAEQKAFSDRLSEYDKEINANEQKYQAMRDQAKAGVKDKKALSDILVGIANAEAKEYANIVAKQEEIEKKKLEETKKKAEEALRDIVKTMDDHEDTLYESALNAQDREIAAVNNYYATTWDKLFQARTDQLITNEQFDTLELKLQKATQEEKDKIKADYLSGKKREAPKPGSENTFAGMSKDQKGDYAIEQAQVIENAISTIVGNARKARSDAKLAALEKERNSELSNKELTENQKGAINAKFDQQARKLKLKQWQAEKRANIASAVIQGALSVIKALPNVPLAIATGIATAAGIGVMLAEKPPAFGGGGYSDTDPAGYTKGDTTYRRSATGRPFRAGEAGKEWIAPAWMLQNPRTANLIGMLESARQNRSFAAGGYNSDQPAPVNQINMDLQPLLSEIKAMNNSIQNLKLSLNYKLVEDMRDEIEVQRKETSW